jgi:acyl-CoA synthetase (AMP-forming)/AMP-acid ligase II
MTNAEAVVEVKKLAYELRRLGGQAGDVVALDVPDQLSIVFTEAVYHEAAISTVIPDRHVVGDAFRVDWIFSSRTPTPQGDARIVTVDAAFLQGVTQNPYGIRPSEEPIETLRIVFSSGTTGRPKAIALGRALEQVFDAALDSWFATSPSLSLMDTGSPAGLGEFFLSVKGGRPYLSAGGASPDAIVRLAELGGVRTLKGSPNQIGAVADELEAQQRTLPSVQLVVVSGTTMPPGLADRMQQVTEGCMIVVNYGSTEAGGATSRPHGSADPFDVGHPQRGSQIEIVDADDVPVPAGTVGRVRHRGPGMASGYLGDPEATARAFRERWFYPGDLGFLRADGGLTLSGRESELLNAGGVKVDPQVLDHAALQHPGVRDACSFDYAGGAGIRRIGLALVADDDADLQALAATLTAEFRAAAPTLVARIAEIPRTATGKPKRRELAERFSEA